jgi:hypothetical protein
VLIFKRTALSEDFYDVNESKCNMAIMYIDNILKINSSLDKEELKINIKRLLERDEINCKICLEVNDGNNTFINCQACGNVFCMECLLKLAIRNKDILEKMHKCSICQQNKIHFELDEKYKKKINHHN